MAGPYDLEGLSPEEYLARRGAPGPPVRPEQGPPEPPNRLPWYVRYPASAAVGGASTLPLAIPTAASGAGLLPAAGMVTVGALSGVAGEAARDLGAPEWLATGIETVPGLAAGGAGAAANALRAVGPWVGRHLPHVILGTGGVGVGGFGGYYWGSGGNVPQPSGLASTITSGAMLAAGVTTLAAGLGAGRLAVSPFFRSPAARASAWRYPGAGFTGALGADVARDAREGVNELVNPLPQPVAEAPIPPRPALPPEQQVPVLRVKPLQ